MKYKKCLLLLVIILIPVMVNSESNYYSYSTFTNYSCIGYNNYIYGTDVTYFDGKYHLVDSYSKCYGMEAAECNSHEAMYTCGNSGTTECEEISLLLTNSNCINTNSDRIMISLKNGIKYEDIKNFYVGKDYEIVNNKYKLLDYEVHNINEINSQEYLSKNFLNYYFCIDNYGISCDRLVRIYKVENNAYGVLWGHYIDVENYFLMSDRYQRIGNKFKLLNPYKIYPALEGEKAGYTCKSHEDECEEMFSMLTYSNYDLHDGGRLTNFTKLEVSNDYYEKEVQLKEKLNLLDYYEEDELDNVFSTNPQVADIKNKKLEIYHVGSTDLIYEDNLNYKVIHLKVTDISDNPITKSTPIAFIVFIVVLIIILTNKKIIEK